MTIDIIEEYNQINTFIKEKLEKIFHEEQPIGSNEIIPFLKSNIELIETFIKLIEVYAKQANIIAEKRELNVIGKTWHHFRNMAERMRRRLVCYEPPDQQQFEATLRWMSQRGEQLDLVIIREIKDGLPYDSEDIQNLIKLAENNLAAKYENNTNTDENEQKSLIQYKYRVFCSESGIPEEFRQQLDIVQSYSAFTIIRTTEDIFSRLKEFYPSELLDPEPISEFENDDSKQDQEIVMQHYLVVKFEPPIPSNWTELIRETQAEVIQPIGRSEAVIYAENEHISNRIRSIPEVQEVSPHKPAIQVQTQYLRKKSDQPVTKEKIAEARLQAARKPRKSRKKNIPIPGILIASFFTERACNIAAKHLEQEGIKIADRPRNTKLVLDVNNYSNPIESLKVIGQQQGLRSLKEKILPTLFNDKACGVLETDIFCQCDEELSFSLTGEGETIAVTDTGLDTGDKENLHLDFQGRVEIENMPAVDYETVLIEGFFFEDEASDRHSGHGTHVAGSIMGSGQQAQQMGVKDRAIPKGIAPEARLIFQAVEKTPKWTSDAIFYYLQETDCMPPVAKLCGIPDDIQKLFSKAYAQGARIHSNSWGEEVDGIYDEKCVDLDEFVWNHKDFLVIVAAGNSGSHSSSGIPGIDQGSVASPAAAKNCLTVGASEHNHEGQFQDTYGQRNPDSFPYAPYNNDNIADNTDDIAAFSSRGPCQDGRRKPDLVAPGTYVLSTRSSQIAENNFAEGYYSPAKDHYMYMSGTSMATPLVAGCAAKVREYLRKMEKIEQPSAALIKASLIHSAQHVKYRYCHKNSVPPADNEQGWGRICLKKVLDPNLPTQVIFIDQKQGLEGDGTEHRYQIKVINDSVLLRVTLVYTDFPGTEETEEQVETKPLVNNLNLTLYPPTHEHRRYYQGNDFDNEGNIDNCNNVEGCIVEQKEVHTGTWTINVVGSDVSRAPQDYALVISGGIDRDSLEEFI